MHCQKCDQNVCLKQTGVLIVPEAESTIVLLPLVLQMLGQLLLILQCLLQLLLQLRSLLQVLLARTYRGHLLVHSLHLCLHQQTVLLKPLKHSADQT